MGLRAMWMAALLSEWRGIGKEIKAERSSSKCTNNVRSAVTLLIDLYSASAEDKEIDTCFFDFHEIGAPPRVMKKPLTDLLESLQDAQSASQKANKEKDGSAERRIPYPGSELRYLRTRRAAVK